MDGKIPATKPIYYVLKGTLTKNLADANEKVTSHSRDVTFKMFPQDGSPAPVVRN